MLFFEPVETIHFDLGTLFSGGDGLGRQRRWKAIAPHLEEGAVEVSDWMISVLGACSPSRWVPIEQLGIDREQAVQLLAMGLIVSKHGEGMQQRHRAADERVRASHWWPLAAAYAVEGRWSRIDSAVDMERNGTNTVEGLVRHFGTPDPEEQCAADLQLPRTEPGAFDALLRRRVTCRNFSDSSMPAAVFATMMERVFAATHIDEPAPGLRFLKRSSPSGGGLHATDAYLLVRRVEGVAAGLYRYLPDSHALSRLSAADEPLEVLAAQMVAGQHWFAEAPVLVALVATYRRSFWKYRNHAKAYRALVLDAGHLSQTLYLSATELGLGAFVTAAINERQIESMFGLDPLSSGVIAVCGFGERSGVLTTTEFDPGRVVWPAATA